MDVYVAFLVWFGGAVAAPNDAGFWRTILWPYHAGKYLATKFVYERSKL